VNIFGYIRVSGLGQVDKDGPQRQREAIADFCAKHNLTSRGEFFEEGVSGTIDGMDRPKFAEMLSKVELLRQPVAASEMIEKLFSVDAIVVERMDRLARDLMVSEFLLKECRARGIKVFCSDQSELNDMASNEGDPTRVMLRQILASVAQWDKSVTVKKLHAARLRLRRLNGTCEGKKRYGKHNLDEHEIKMEIIELHEKKGLSFVAIADMLNGRGLVTRHKKAWTKANVFSIYSERRIRERLKNARSLHTVSQAEGVQAPVQMQAAENTPGPFEGRIGGVA
jgi:DNA invertase Pin-like site-specific DNA recombinase